MRVHFSERAFDYQTLRAMSYTTFGGAEPGEVLTTVERIDDGDTGAWHEEWYRTAERVAGAAERAAAAGHGRTAGFASLRAHTYFRSAEFFLGPADRRRRPSYERSRESFRAGIEFLEPSADTVEIPYEDTTLPGYRFLPASADGELPTVVLVGGFDSLAEELYFLCGVNGAAEPLNARPPTEHRRYEALTGEDPSRPV